MKKLLYCMILFQVNTHCFAYNFIQYIVVDTLRQELYPHDATYPYRHCMIHIWIPDKKNHPAPSPLILFSHALGENFNGMTYTQLCQYCVQQGYVVASVSHTYGCKPIQSIDGRVAPYLFPAAFHEQSDKHMFDIEADIWRADMMSALRECELQNELPESLLYQRIDTSIIGVMGHSLGGAVAIQCCHHDNRIKAAINLDGPLYGTGVTYPIEKPLMFIIGSSAVSQPTALFAGGVPFHKDFLWRYYFNQLWLPQLNAFIASLNTDVYKITIDKIVHGTFSDEALYPDEILLPWIIDGNRAHEIIHAYVGAFFDKYLKGNENPLLKTNIFPWTEEVKIVRYNYHPF